MGATYNLNQSQKNSSTKDRNDKFDDFSKVNDFKNHLTEIKYDV